MSLQSLNRLTIVFFGLAAALPFAGCQSLTNVRVEDESTPAFSGTLISRPEEMRYGRGDRARGGVEFGYERYRGESVQEIDINHFLSLDDGRINGPQRSSNEASVHHGHIAFNQLLTLGKHFEVEPAIGVSFDKMKVTALGSLPGSRQLMASEREWGALISVTPRWNFNRFLGIESRVSLSGNFEGTTAGGNVTSLVIRPTPEVAFKVGYYTRDYDFNAPAGTSDFEAEFAGFSANLTLVF